MSRVHYSDDDSKYWQLDNGRWQRNSIQVLRSKRGQMALRELEQALLDLPKKRLIEDDFARVEIYGDGPVAEATGVCVLGAYALYRGYSQAELTWISEELYSANATAEWAVDSLGLVFTLAWNLVELNDEGIAQTPEDRYRDVLAFVQSAIEKQEKEAVHGSAQR